MANSATPPQHVPLCKEGDQEIAKPEEEPPGPGHDVSSDDWWGEVGEPMSTSTLSTTTSSYQDSSDNQEEEDDDQVTYYNFYNVNDETDPLAADAAAADEPMEPSDVDIDATAVDPPAEEECWEKDENNDDDDWVPLGGVHPPLVKYICLPCSCPQVHGKHCPEAIRHSTDRIPRKRRWISSNPDDLRTATLQKLFIAKIKKFEAIYNQQSEPYRAWIESEGETAMSSPTPSSLSASLSPASSPSSSPTPSSSTK